MNREDFKQLALAGTVTFPNTFPQLAELSLRAVSDPTFAIGKCSDNAVLLVATERPSARVTIIRSIPIADVRALLIPRELANVCIHSGTWYLGKEVEIGLRLQLNNASRVFGIVYLAEATPTLLEVHAGMTAAESAQYYPPLPCDRSHNHYDPQPGTLSPYVQDPCAPLRRLSCETFEACVPIQPSQRMSCETFEPSTPLCRLSCETVDAHLEAYSRENQKPMPSESTGPAPFKGKTGTQ